MRLLSVAGTAVLSSLFMALLVLPVARPTAALAESKSHIVGALALELDDQVWRVVNESQTLWTLDRLDLASPAAVSLRVVDIDVTTTCSALARAQLSPRLFTNPQETSLDIAGMPAVLVHANSRCRSLSPLGQSLCITQGNKAYLFSQTYDGYGTRGVAFPFEKDFFKFFDAIEQATTAATTP